MFHLFIYATHNRSVYRFTASIGFLRTAIRLRMNREPILELVVPGFEPGTATMASKRITTKLTDPPCVFVNVPQSGAVPVNHQCIPCLCAGSRAARL